MKSIRTSRVVGLVLVFSMLMTGLALADNIKNNITTVAGERPVEHTIPGSGTNAFGVGFVLEDTGGSCNVSAASPLTMTFTGLPDHVTPDAATTSFSSCRVTQTVNFNVSASASPGNSIITPGMPSAGNGWNCVNCDFTLKLSAASTPPPDTTAPVVTLATLKGGTNQAASAAASDWFNIASADPSAGIDLRATATDASGIKSLTCTDSYKTNADATASVSTLITATNASPFTSPKSETASLASGIHNVTCTATDGADNAGASAGSTSFPAEFKVDLVPPSVSVTGVTNGAFYLAGSVPTAGCSTTDAHSGVKTNASLSSSGGPLGSITATCSGAEDNAGNGRASAVTATYTVWDASFLSPLKSGNINMVQRGRVIPVQINVGDNNGFVSGLSPHVQILTGNLDGDTNADDPVAAVSTSSVSSADSGQIMREVDGKYLYNLQVPNVRNATYTIRVRPNGAGTQPVLNIVIQTRNS